ncbi:MAG: HGGxSTG domain-containing protein [Hyphomicrobiaceae bacterium]
MPTRSRPEQVCSDLTRAGTPCQAPVVKGRKRCRRHGGLSTGPRTPDEKERVRAARERGLAKWRAERSVGLPSSSDVS